jgi:hypothetical protein
MACVCGTQPLWQQAAHVPLPHWPGNDDDLFVYFRRRTPGAPLGPRPL